MRTARGTPQPTGPPPAHDHGTRRAGAIANNLATQPYSAMTVHNLNWYLPDHLQSCADILETPAPIPLEVPSPRSLQYLPRTHFLNQRYGPFSDDRDNEGKLILPDDKALREVEGDAVNHREPPTRVRYPVKRITTAEMRKRVRNLLEYVGGVQDEEARRAERASRIGVPSSSAPRPRLPPVGSEERRGSSSLANGNTEDVRPRSLPPAGPPPPSASQLLDEFTRDLIAFQEAFNTGDFDNLPFAQPRPRSPTPLPEPTPEPGVLPEPMATEAALESEPLLELADTAELAQEPEAVLEGVEMVVEETVVVETTEVVAEPLEAPEEAEVEAKEDEPALPPEPEVEVEEIPEPTAEEVLAGPVAEVEHAPIVERMGREVEDIPPQETAPPPVASEKSKSPTPTLAEPSAPASAEETTVVVASTTSDKASDLSEPMDIDDDVTPALPQVIEAAIGVAAADEPMEVDMDIDESSAVSVEPAVVVEEAVVEPISAGTPPVIPVPETAVDPAPAEEPEAVALKATVVTLTIPQSPKVVTTAAADTMTKAIVEETVEETTTAVIEPNPAPAVEAVPELESLAAADVKGVPTLEQSPIELEDDEKKAKESVATEIAA